MSTTAYNGWEMSIARHIAAPPDRVWHIMTARQMDWWCPLPWRAEAVEQDWRAGGINHVVMHGPDGEVNSHPGIFLDVTPGVRFVATDSIVRAPDGTLTPAGPFMIGCWEIAPEGDGTLYTASARHWDEDAAKRHAEMGFAEGWAACADQLAALCDEE
jgi:uncharacterized protein YndB with AHSA1/START domain